MTSRHRGTLLPFQATALSSVCTTPPTAPHPLKCELPEARIFAYCPVCPAPVNRMPLPVFVESASESA